MQQKRSLEKIFELRLLFCAFKRTHRQTLMKSDMISTAHRQEEKRTQIPMDVCGFAVSSRLMIYDAHSCIVLNLFCGFSDCIAFHSNSKIVERTAPILLYKFIVGAHKDRIHTVYYTDSRSQRMQFHLHCAIKCRNHRASVLCVGILFGATKSRF